MPLYPILEAAVAGMQPMADEKQVQIDLNCNRHIVVSIDIDKMKQIMTNLLDNAVKYTQEGGHVWVNVTSQPDREIQICVEDAGVGIDDADLNFIFDRFHRAADSKNSGVGGIGLGLPIVKNLVELHGGKIWAESEVGVGSRFYVTLKNEC